MASWRFNKSYTNWLRNRTSIGWRASWEKCLWDEEIFSPPRRQEHQGERGLGFLELVGDAADAVFDEVDVEVDEEAEGFLGEL